MIRIAVTGGIACGKSLAAACMEAAGVPVCEADAVAHTLMAPGTPVYRRVVEAFGTGILSSTGEIDRRILGKRVFADDRQREQLNAWVHPAVWTGIESWLDARRVEGAIMAAAVIPLLFEAGMDQGWDAILCIVCDPERQMERLRQRGLSEADCRARLRAQMPMEAKVNKADYVIRNDGRPEILSGEVRRILKTIQERQA